MTTSKLQRAKAAFDAAMAHLAATRDEYAAERRKIALDQDYTPEAKNRLMGELTAKYQAETRTRQVAAADALAYYRAGLNVTANPAGPQGTDAVVARLEALEATARVRSILDRGTTPEQVIERAKELGDIATLNALRTEAAWLDTGHGSGFDAVPGSQPKGFLARIDEARADVIGGEQGEAIRENLTMQDQTAGWVAKIERASSELEGTTLEGAVADRLAGITSARGDTTGGAQPADGTTGEDDAA